MVEFALILPLLLGLVVAIIQFGSAFNYWNDLNQMAGDGARFAAVDRVPGGGSLTGPTGYIAGQADASELRANADACLIVLDQASGNPKLDLSKAKVGDAVRVQTSMTKDYSFIPIGPLAGATTVRLRGNATMRIERVSSDGTGLANLGTAC